jgi:TetR/AcrR family transcriptional regulator, cholesterol catabolism regulator
MAEMSSRARGIIPQKPPQIETLVSEIPTDTKAKRTNPADADGLRTLHPSRMTPRQRDRRYRLIDSAISLLGTFEYEEVSVKDVSEHANVSLGTLYNYFSSKERLFAEAFLRWANTLPANVRNRPLRASVPAERLMEAMHLAIGAFERKPQMARLVNLLLNSPDPMAMEVMSQVGVTTSDVYLQALAAIDPVIARRAIDVVNAVLSVSLRDWSLGRCSMSYVYDRLDSAISLVVPG